MISTDLASHGSSEADPIFGVELRRRKHRGGQSGKPDLSGAEEEALASARVDLADGVVVGLIGGKGGEEGEDDQEPKKHADAW